MATESTQFNVKISEELARRIRLESAQHDITVMEFVSHAFCHWLSVPEPRRKSFYCAAKEPKTENKGKVKV